MPSDRSPDEYAREWLERAASNLYRASERTSSVVCLEDLCFDAQQAAEKAIKAVLIKLGLEFPYVHDLGKLLDLLIQAGVDVPDDVRQADSLTPYAVVTRYPGVVGPVGEEDHREAVEIAEAVFRWAEEQTQH